MPVVKPNQPLKPRPPIIFIYGEPGVCKTSIVNTCEEPLLIDFDRGVDRSILRKDVLQVENWDEVLTEERNGLFASYKTIGIDTAKAALDDFLMTWIVQQDAKYGTPKYKLQAYGQMGDNFKLFINNRRAQNAAIVIIAHSKKDEDTKKNIPDVTGQSAQLLLRIADQVGYVYVKNGKRMIQFEPTEETFGKNVAGISVMEVPDKATDAFQHFGAFLVNKVSESLASMSEEQREAIAKSEEFQTQLAGCDTPEKLTAIAEEIGKLPVYLKAPLRQAFQQKLKDLGLVYDKDKGYIQAPVAEATAVKDVVNPEQSNGTAGHAATNGQANGEVKDEKAGTEQKEVPAVESSNAAFERLMEETKDDVSEFIPKGATRFNTIYKTVEALETVIKEAKKTDQLASLFFVNDPLVNANLELRELFKQKTAELKNGKEAVA